MSIVNVNLGSSDDQAAIFYDLKYQCDHQGGNHTETFFEIMNLSGNNMNVQVAAYQTQNGKTELQWSPVNIQPDLLRISFRGSAENAEFLSMLKLILEAEKMVEIIKP